MGLRNQLESLAQELEKALSAIPDKNDPAQALLALEDIRIVFLSRKGRLAEIMTQLPKLPPEERPSIGQLANVVKTDLTDKLDTAKTAFEAQIAAAKLALFDATLPPRAPWQGSMHPVSLVMEDICSIFTSLGFSIASGPQVETDYNNFEALNMPPEHPARDMQDTLYINPKIVLRTHTSGMQIRTMLAQQPPVAIIVPGKVYRRDSDITHTPMFHQIEGLYVDKNVSLGDLRGVLTYFSQAIFGKDTQVRFRSSFFPFTEPSVEVDISCFLCEGKGHIDNEPCRVCKTTGWVEILGCGMIDPAVFEAVGYDPKVYSGFAFGMGLERIAMLRYGVTDLRMFFENDVRFLSQFR